MTKSYPASHIAADRKSRQLKNMQKFYYHAANIIEVLARKKIQFFFKNSPLKVDCHRNKVIGCRIEREILFLDP